MTTRCSCSTPPRSSPRSPPGRSRSCRPCAAVPSSTCSTRTPPVPGCPSRSRPSGCRADVINFSAKGSSVSKGESLKDTALTLQAMGADAVVVRHHASGAPHRLADLDRRQRGQRRRRHPRAPHPGPARRLHHAPPHGPARGPAGHHRRRRAAQPGGPLQRPAAGHARVPRPRLVAPPTLLPVGVESWPCSISYDLDARAAQERRRDDAAGPARADERVVLPDRAGVLPAVRPRRQPHGHPARRRDRDASRAR